MKLIFWQNIPSIHQAPVISEIAKIWLGEVLVVAEKGVDSERLQQGWHQPDFSPAKLLISPSRQKRVQILIDAPDETVHIFSGFCATPETTWTFKRALKLSSTVGVYAERADCRGVLGWLRSIRYSLLALQYDHLIEFLLVTGSIGQDWFEKRGFSRKKIIPYGYFVSQVEDVKSRHERLSEDSKLKFIFVGNLIPLKGFDLLLEALVTLKCTNWHLTVIGDGPEREKYKKLSARYKMLNKISWLGKLPNADVRQKMIVSDYLILPSRYDGWGAVVNESLMCGTPVIVSDACGASDLIGGDYAGYVFPSGDTNALAKILKKVIDKGSVPKVFRVQLLLWIKKTISPNIIARYLLSIIRSSLSDQSYPVAPWR